MKYFIYINETLISPDDVAAWEVRRLSVVSKKLGLDLMQDSSSLDVNVRKLAEGKRNLGYEEIFCRLKRELKLSAGLAKAMNILSFGRRIACVTEIRVEGISAAEVDRGIEKLMLENTLEHDLVNLGACPDHYALRALGGGRLEVIETTGGSPFPIQFFIEYGEENGLSTPRDDSYPYQSAGVARLQDGTVIGGIRHQFRDEGNGCKARLTVEFPLSTPGYFIRQHQLHLACEFGRWFQWLLSKKQVNV